MQSEDPDKVRRERDLYLRLLQLGEQTNLERFLGDALGLLVEMTSARPGYLEISDDELHQRASRWSSSHGFTDPEGHAFT